MKQAVEHIVIPGAIPAAGVTLAATRQRTWEGLVLAPSKGFDQVYLRPGADFAGYTKVMIAQVEVAFAGNPQGDCIDRAFARVGVSETQVRRAISASIDAAGDLFAQAWMKGGYGVVQAPGPDVMQVRIGVLDLAVTPSEALAAGRATFFVEVRDSTSGAVLGRAVAQRPVADNLLAGGRAAPIAPISIVSQAPDQIGI